MQPQQSENRLKFWPGTDHRISLFRESVDAVLTVSRGDKGCYGLRDPPCYKLSLKAYASAHACAIVGIAQPVPRDGLPFPLVLSFPFNSFTCGERFCGFSPALPLFSRWTSTWPKPWKRGDICFLIVPTSVFWTWNHATGVVVYNYSRTILASQGLRIQRPWQNRPGLNIFHLAAEYDSFSQSQLLPSVYQRIRQGVDLHKVLKSWPAFLEWQGMPGGCQPIVFASFMCSDRVWSSSSQIWSSLIINSAGVKKCSAQAGLPGSLQPCVEPWLVRMF